MVKSPGAFEIIFDKLLTKIFLYKKLSFEVAVFAKKEYSQFLQNIVKESKRNEIYKEWLLACFSHVADMYVQFLLLFPYL